MMAWLPTFALRILDDRVNNKRSFLKHSENASVDEDRFHFKNAGSKRKRHIRSDLVID